MAFELPKLSYGLDALEPYIKKETLEFHYGKHHQTYVSNLNNLIKGSEFEGKNLEEIIRLSEGGVFNNAAQIWNHTFYFESFKPNGGGEPKGKILDAINRDFGSFEKFKEEFSNAAATLFGSGWAWLVKNGAGKLEVLKEANAGNPMTKGFVPLLTCDVWEHAYYLDVQNRRPEYIQNFWKVLDWDKVSNRF